jgi:hypothetical protein
MDLILLTDYITVANNFWGLADAGVNPLLQRMQNAKQTCDELKTFYTGMSQRKHYDARTDRDKHAPQLRRNIPANYWHYLESH